MKHPWFSTSLAIGLISAGVVLAPSAKADAWDKMTVVTFKVPVEIPGMVLTPGTYVMKLLDEPADRDIVEFYNQDQSHLYKMVFGIHAYRVFPTSDPVITFQERANGAPRAVDKWFWPGSLRGEELVYHQAHPLQTAEATPPPAVQPAPPPAPPTIAKAAPAPEPAPAPAPAPQVAQAEPAPAPAPPAAEPAPAAAPVQELPKTASDLPLTVLLGGFSVAAGAYLRKRRVTPTVN
jgi:hypothetical protein